MIDHDDAIDEEMEDENAMSFEEFIDHVEFGAFTDDDGIGLWGNALIGPFSPSVHISPSQILRGTYMKPEGATHVFWYNK